MSIADALARSSSKPAGKRPYFYAQEVERVLTVTLAIAQELAVTRQRLDTLERLLEQKGVTSQDDIERFEPTPVQASERGLWNQEYVTRVFRIFQQEAEAVQANIQNEKSAEDHFEDLKKEK